MYFWMALMIAGTTHTYFTGWSQWAVLLVSSLIMVHFLMASIDKGAQS